MKLRDKEKSLRKHHIKLWTWVSENPECDKDEWPGWGKLPKWMREDNNVMYLLETNDCFACACAYLRSENIHGDHCSDCPIQWVKNKPDASCLNPSSVYYRWRTAVCSAEGKYTKAERAKRIVRALTIAGMWKEVQQ